MAGIPNDIIESVKKEADIVAIINQYVALTKRGNNYTCSCPFHEDNNPSFSVSPDKQIYKCFSCGRGGNVFGFLQEMEGISFPEAVKKVAELSNIALDSRYFETGQAVSQPHQRLLDLHEKARDFYHFYLTQTVAGEAAYAYLKQRELKEETLADFHLGLAPDNPQLLIQYLTEAGFNHEEMLQSGIFYEASQGLMDRFHGRIIFPLEDRQGRTVAFSGRIYQANPGDDQKVAKYVNSPETDIFHKSSLIYHFAQARPHIRRLNQVLICEGYLDVIALSQAGFPQAVATMGTSLTSQHLGQLGKVTQEIIFVFDGDAAGQKATARAFELSLTLPRHTIKAVSIPGKMDPDEWIKSRGADSFKSLINQAIPRYEFLKNYLQQEYQLADLEQRALYINRLLDLVAQLPSPIERTMRLQALAEEFGLDLAMLEEQLAQVSYRHRKEQAKESDRPKQDSPDKWDKAHSSGFPDQALPSNPVQAKPGALDDQIKSLKAYHCERYILSNLVFNEPAWQFIEGLEQPLLFVHPSAQAIYYQLEHFYYEKGGRLPLTGILDVEASPDEQQYLASLIWDHAQTDYSEQAMQDCLNTIDAAFTEIQLKELHNKLKQAQIRGDKTKMNEYLVEILRLSRQLKKN